MVTELNSEFELKPCIVRIRRPTGEVAGAGFLVGEKHILTCAHVVAKALGLAQDHANPPQESVQLDFPLLAPGKDLTAQVVVWQPPRPDGRGDIAGLQLNTLPPPEANPAHLVAAENLWRHSFRAFGFPRGNEDGTWASGTLLDRQAAGWVQIEDVKETGYRVQPGFSGTPVWDDDLEGVVGMVVAAEARAEVKAAFTIPTNVLLASWPELDQLAPLPCPYQGLRAFQQQHASYFFGREEFTEQLIQAVQEQPLTAVVGPSGSGKSSVVFAGLLPRLRQEANWVIISCRLGREPFQELATGLIASLEPQMSEIDQLIQRNKLVRALHLGEVHLHEVVERILEKRAEAGRLLLVCDQFEELYTLSQGAKERTRYLDELLQAVAVLSQHRELQFSLVLTLRADFFGHASFYRPFADALQDSILILGPMNRKELQDAIEKPAHLLGVRIEEGLSERLLEAVGEEPGNLPLLEFALTQLWSRRRYRMLTHAAYDEIGGVKQALAVHAEAAFRKLDPQEEQRVRRIFTQLVQPSQATEDTRRIATESELGPENWGLAARLADERLVVTGRDEASEEETAEIVHEVLIREWERLRQWTNEDREFRQWQERLRTALRQWEVIGRDNGALLRGGLLAEAEHWVGERGEELAEAERDYILTSITMREQEQERVARERMRRRIILGLAIGLGLALILALLAGWQWREADSLRQRAEMQEQVAVAQKQEAEKQRGEAVAQRGVAEVQRQEAETQRRIVLSRQDVIEGLVYENLGEYEQALENYQQALVIAREVGDKAGEGLALNSIGGAYQNLRDYPKALLFLQQAVEFREKQLGPEHPDTARSLNNLAGLYYDMGEYQKALPLYQRALEILEIREKQLGPERLDTATSLNNMAILYRNLGEYQKALPLHQRALEIREKQLGPEHPETATSLNNLAFVYKRMGDYLKALPLLQRALAIAREVGDRTLEEAVLANMKDLPEN